MWNAEAQSDMSHFPVGIFDQQVFWRKDFGIIIKGGKYEWVFNIDLKTLDITKPWRYVLIELAIPNISVICVSIPRF